MINDIELSSNVVVDDINTEIARSYDFEFQGTVKTSLKDFTDLALALSSEFSIGLIVGSSGSGKSSAAKLLGLSERCHEWDSTKSVCSHFDDVPDAQNRLGAVGLNSIPSWLKPYKVLSTGEKFRADVAIALGNDVFIDEFTSVVDRTVAMACSMSLRKHVDRNGLKGVVLSSCHYDIIEWLQPDWVYDANTGIVSRGSHRQRAPLEIEITPCDWSYWSMFSNHHYLDSKINKAASFWVATLNGSIVGFSSTISFPSGSVKNARRGHRTVVLPDYQGLGIGVRISDAVAQMTIDLGHRYFSKTSHVRMGDYREKSVKWRATSKNKKARPDYKAVRKTKEDGHKMKHVTRIYYSHEYIGDPK